jgi:hypothetical protein
MLHFLSWYYIGKGMEFCAKNILLAELTKRQTRNSSYSIRAFARDLKMGATSLSDVLAGRRSISKSNLKKVIEYLCISPLDQEKLWSHYSGSIRHIAVDEKLYLDELSFRLISDWYYIAILNLSKLKGNKATSSWISSRIGISKKEAETALQRLVEMKLIKKENGKMVRTANPLSTSRDIPSAAIRKHHNQNLQLAEKSLHRDSVHLREFGSITMPINIDKIPAAKDYLLKVREKIADLLSAGETTEVYTLSFQLFPITKINQVRGGTNV